MSKFSSKYNQYKDIESVFPHKHCSVCKKMIPEDDGEFEEYCSAECSGQILGQKKNKKKRNIIMVGSYAVMIVVFIIIALTSSN